MNERVKESRWPCAIVGLLALVGLSVLLMAGAPPNRWHTADVTRTVLASAARTSSATSVDIEIDPTTFRGAMFLLDVSSASGTLDLALQRKDPVSANYLSIPGATFPSISAATTIALVIYPGVEASANVKVSDVGSGTLRAVASLSGSPSFVFSLAAVPVR